MMRSTLLVLLQRTRARTRSARVRLLRGDGGGSAVELALMLPLFLLLLVGTVDMGRAFYTAIEVSSAAAAGVAYGVQNPTDTAGMQAAATLDAADVTGIVPVATWGCECSDGSSGSANCASTPSCTTNVVKYVQVVTTFTYVPLFKYPGVPVSIPLTGKARMRVPN
jgi:Flp pilus assembly protein TadG